MNEQPQAPVQIPTLNQLQEHIVPRQTAVFESTFGCKPAAVRAPGSPPVPVSPAGPSPEARALLFHKALHPHDDLALEACWRAIGVRNGSKKRAIKEELLRHGLAVFERKGRLSCLQITPRGWEYLGMTPPKGKGVGGATHKTIVCQLTEDFKNRGYDVRVEKEIGGDGKRVDIVAYREKHIVGIEVGLSDWRQELRNIQADLKSEVLDLLVFVSPDPAMLEKVRTECNKDVFIREHIQRIRFLKFNSEAYS